MAKSKKSSQSQDKKAKGFEVSDKPLGEMRVPRLLDFYRTNVIKALMKEFNYKNQMEVPKIEKIVVNMGVGKAVAEPKLIEAALNDLSLITGQKPAIRKAKKAISNFKLREGMPVGIKVTLRKNRMYEFFDRVMNIAAPRIRDFRGFKADGFDGRGNYNFGITEQIVFPEIDYDKVQTVMGMNITIVTSAKTDQESRSLLEKMGVPFTRRQTSGGENG